MTSRRWRNVRVRRYLRRFGDRRTLAADLKAGLALGAESVPDGLAAGALAGINPVLGLNGYLVGTVAGALSTGSLFMTVQATGAMSVILTDVPATHGRDAETAIATLTVLTGLTMLALGLARLGSLVRFVPSAVLFGFANAVAINIVLGQLANFTRYNAHAHNRIARAADTVMNVAHFSWPTVAVGATTIALIFAFERLGAGAIGLVLAVVVGSALAQAFSADSVSTLGDTVEVTRSLPSFTAPSVAAVPGLLIPALALALVGLVQGAGISGTIPNPNGRYPDASTDFRGQGLANLATGMLQGMPVGGSMSATSLARTAGAKTALTGVVAGVTMVLAIVALGPLIGHVAMPALAGLLILVGLRSLKPHQFVMVWRTGRTQTVVFATTFVLTLTIPLQYAVMAGVGLSVVIHVIQQSSRVRVVRWTFESPAGRPLETAPPSRLRSGDTVILTPYGTLFFASAQAFREQLPTPSADASGAVVIIRLRGTEELGVTFLTMLREYATELGVAGAELMLTGVDDNLAQQLTATGVHRVIGPDNIFRARRRLGDSLDDALQAIAARRDPDSE